jgi:hypothetical protein
VFRRSQVVAADAAIVGAGATAYYRRGGSGPRSALSLSAEAILAAYQDAGLSPEQTDGFACYGNAGAGHGQHIDTPLLMETLGIPLEVDGDTPPFREAARQHRLMFPRCVRGRNRSKPLSAFHAYGWQWPAFLLSQSLLIQERNIVPHYKFGAGGYWDASEKFKPLADRDDGLRLKLFVMGDEDDDDAPAALVIEMPPGGVIGHHAHDCERLEIIVRGSLQLPDGTMLGPGDVMVAKPWEFYGPHIAGPDGCVTFEVFSRASEAHAAHFRRPDGSTVRIERLLREGIPADAVGMEDVPARVAAILVGRKSRSDGA